MSCSHRLGSSRTWARPAHPAALALNVAVSSLSSRPFSAGAIPSAARRSLRYAAATGHQQQPKASRARTVAVAAAASGEGSALEDTQRELKELEAERDAAVATAESSARAAMKLTDLVALLDNMAMDKVKSGDDEIAKQVLQEKSSAKEVLEKTSAKAQVNYALAAALAQKIGTKQKEILLMLQSGGPTGTSAPSAPAAPPRPTPSPRPPASPRPPPAPEPPTPTWGPGPQYTQQTSWSGLGDNAWSGGSSSSSSSSSSSPAGDYGFGSGFAVPKWQQSLEEAKQRASEAERSAERAGRAARLSAEESIAAARRRLQDNASESILSARSRISSERVGADASIAEAQERLRAQDAEVLAYVQRIMARYRRGEYVAEDELEFAFQQLEKRFLM